MKRLSTEEILAKYQENFREQIYCRKHNYQYSKYLVGCPFCWEDNPLSQTWEELLQEIEEEYKK